MSKNKKNHRRNVCQSVLKALQERYPGAVFNPKNPRVLVIGTRERILEELPDIPERKIRTFLGWWCNRVQYLKVMAKNGMYRYHVSGRRGKAITLDEKRDARRRLDELGVRSPVLESCEK